MTREPDGSGARHAPVTAQTPGTERAHESHDRLLVARHAVGDDLAADERAALVALLASCPSCDRLVEELAVVRRTTAASLSPMRARDFRITPQQARALRPSAWRRLLARLSAPRMDRLRPVAGATLAVGIVLVGASAFVPRETQVLVPPDAPALASTTSPVDGGAGEAMPEASPDAVAREADPRSHADAQAKASDDPAGIMEMVPVPTVSAPRGSAPSSPDTAADQRALGLVAGESPGPGGDPGPPETQAMMAQDGATDAAMAPALFLLGLLLAAASGVVLVLAWLARRGSDPLLR